jgi:hypothetical protein
MRVAIPDARAGAHDDQEVVRPPVGDRLSLVDHDAVDADAATIEHVAVDAHRIGTQVFKDQCLHGIPCPSFTDRVQDGVTIETRWTSVPVPATFDYTQKLKR